MGILDSKLLASSTTFHKIIPEKCTRPLGQIAMEVVFGDPKKYRVETLTFEVVNF